MSNASKFIPSARLTRLATSVDLPKILRLTLSLFETVDVHRKHPDKLLQVTLFGVSPIKFEK